MRIEDGIEFAIRHAQTIERLEEVGWEVEDGLRFIEVRSPISNASDLLDALSSTLEAMIEGALYSTTGFRLTATSGSFVVSEAPENAGDHYTGPELEAARKAQGGDVSAVRRLGGGWRAEARLDLARGLQEDQLVAWRVVRHISTFARAIEELAWWSLRELYQEYPLVCMALSPHPIRFVAPGMSVVDPTHASDGIDLPAFEDKRAAMVAASGSSPPPGVPLPEELTPRGEVTNAEEVVSVVGPRAAASAWAWLATSVEHNGDARLAFFGLRTVSCNLRGAGIGEPSEAQDALTLYRWATLEQSPDRFVAIRQVISVYDTDAFLHSPLEVRRAAEPIYRALRTSTVAEVVASQREARRYATDAAREAATAALAAARSVGERTLAALAALGALVVANATTAQVSDETVQRLALGVASFTLALALWSVIVEGPLISVPLRSLRGDLDVVGDLLSEEARDEVLQLEVVKCSRKRASVVRVASPLAYGAVTAVALWLAHPHPAWLWLWLNW